MKWGKRLLKFLVIAVLALGWTAIVFNTLPLLLILPQLNPALFYITPICLFILFALLAYKYKNSRIIFAIFALIPLCALGFSYNYMSSFLDRGFYQSAAANHAAYKGDLAAHDKIRYRSVLQPIKSDDEISPFVILLAGVSNISAWKTTYAEGYFQSNNKQFNDILESLIPKTILPKLHERELCFLESIETHFPKDYTEESKNAWRPKIKDMRARALADNAKYPNVEIIRKPDGSCLFADP